MKTHLSPRLGSNLALAVLFAAAALGQANSQTSDVPPPALTHEHRFAFSSEHNIGFSAAAPFEGKVVKGAPYSAEGVTEHTQALADGNRIVHKTTFSVARDSQGRTRREQSFDAIGPWSSNEDTPHFVFINDPLAGVKYVLEPNSHKARKSRAGEGGPFISVMTHGPEGEKTKSKIKDAEGRGLATEGELKREVEVVQMMERHHKAHGEMEGEVKTESLGSQVIEGVQAEGKRETHVIPAGQMGNERPIDVVSETWYSPELQTMVMSRYNDPMMGETVYKLTNISRAEPASSLFEVPSDYTLVDEQQERKTAEEKMKQERAR